MEEKEEIKQKILDEYIKEREKVNDKTVTNGKKRVDK